jgi:hypothetical protein
MALLLSNMENFLVATRPQSRSCSVPQEFLLFAYHQLIPVTSVRVIIRIAIVAAVRIKASTKATASHTIVADTSTIYRHPVGAETTVAHRMTAAAKTAMASTMAASAVASTTSGERDCAGGCCCYERDDRSRCNYLFAHFSKLPMFHLIASIFHLIWGTASAEMRVHESPPFRLSARRSFIR